MKESPQAYLEYTNTVPPPQHEVDHFNSSPWTRTYLTHPSFKPIPTPSRVQPSKSGIQDNFFARTLNSPSTIPHWLVLVRKDFSPPAELDADPPFPISREEERKGKGQWQGKRGVTPRPITQTDLILLLDLGDDVTGYFNTLHGGVLGAIFDEVLGLCVESHRQYVNASTNTNPGAGTGAIPPLFTADLRVKYLGPVKSPGLVVFRTWLEWRRGRKWVLKGQAFGGGAEDGGTEGRVLAEAEGVWVASRVGVL